jgi:hypothetical protein
MADGLYTSAFELLEAFTRKDPKPSDLEVRHFAATLKLALPAPRWPADYADLAEARRRSVIAQLEGTFLPFEQPCDAQ